MTTHKKHLIRFIENILSSVSVVHVRVDDGHASNTVRVPRVRSRDADVVEQAESATAARDDGGGAPSRGAL